MAERSYITFEQAHAAIRAMVEKAPELGPEPVAMTIVDEAGNLVAYAQLDKLRMFSRRHSPRKAYTAAITGTDSGAYGENLRNQGRSLSDIGGDPNLTPGQGGVVVRSRDGTIMGGVGVGGYPSGEADEQLARIGLEAMNI